jgi:hypothetical protein
MLFIASLPADERIAALHAVIARPLAPLAHDVRVVIAQLTGRAVHHPFFADRARNVPPLEAHVDQHGGPAEEHVILAVRIGPLEGHVTFVRRAAAEWCEPEISSATWVVPGTGWVQQWIAPHAGYREARVLGEAAHRVAPLIGATRDERLERFDELLQLGAHIGDALPMLSNVEIRAGLAERGVDVPVGASVQQQAFALTHPDATWLPLAGGLFVVADRPTRPLAFDNLGNTLPAEREALSGTSGEELSAEQVDVASDRRLTVAACCDDGSMLATDPEGRVVQIERDGTKRPEAHPVIGGVWVDVRGLTNH